jgi:hypothetical protein
MREWVSSTGTDSDNLKSELIAKTEGFIEKSKNSLFQKNEEIITAIRNSLGSFTTSMDEGSESLSMEFETLENRLVEITRSLADVVSTKITDTKSTMTSSIQTATNEIGGSLDTFGTNINSIVDEAETEENQILSDHDSELTSISSSLRTDSLSTIERFTTSMDESLNSFGQTARTATDSMKQQMNMMSEQTNSSLSSAVDSIRTTSSEGIQQMQKRAVELSEGMVEDSTRVLNTKSESLQESLREIQTKMKSINQESLTTSSTLLGNTRTTLGEHLESISINAKEKIDQMLREVKTSIFSEIDDAISTARFSLETEITNQLDRITTRFGELESQIDDEMQIQKGEHTSAISSLITSLDEVKSTFIERVESERKAMRGQLNLQLEQHGSEARASISQAYSESDTTIDDLIQQLETMITDLRDKSRMTESDLSQSVESAGETLSQANETLANSTKQKTYQVKERIRVAIEESLIHNKDQIHSSLVGANNRLGDELSELALTAETDIGSIGSEGKSKLSEIVTDARSKMSDAISDIQSNQSTFESQLSDAVSDISSTLTGHSEILKNTLSEIVDNFGIRARAITETKTTEIESAFSSAKTKLDTVSRSMLQDTIRETEEYKEKTSTAFISTQDDIISKLKSFGKQVSDETTGGYDDLKERSGSLRNTLGTMQSKLEQDAMIGLSETALDDAFADTRGEVPGSEIASLLSKVWERVGSTDFPGAKQTWTIVTRDAVLAHIKDMLQRAKSKVTLIYPSPLEVPTDILAELKTTVGVELVVTEGNLSPVRPLIGRGNIRVRTRSERDVYACVRDSEEVLLAPAAPSDVDVVGVTTEEDGFIRFIMSIVGPIFQAKTKLIREGDI